MKYFVEYRDGKAKRHTKFFDTIETALKYFKKAEDKGFYVTLYNCK